MDYNCRIVSNEGIKGPYRRIVFYAPEIAKQAKAGQFVHIRITPMRDKILRRPFSICDTDAEKGLLTLVYKTVGAGTEVLASMRDGETCDILGPLGNGYSIPDGTKTPILIVGGYGSAATFLLAKNAPRKGIIIIGARTASDILLADEYRACGFDVRIATNDGSLGTKGLVTDLLADAVSDAGGKDNVIVSACGPTPMLIALGKLANSDSIPCELSLDEHMCCGVGACFACVVKVVDSATSEGWRYSRSCKEGPVYNATEVYYG